MVMRVALALIAYVDRFVPFLHDRFYREAVVDALVYRILHKVDWFAISKLELVDSLLTLIRRHPMRALVMSVFDSAFQVAYTYRSLFTSCVDRAIGPSVLSGMDSCPEVPEGPVLEFIGEGVSGSTV